MKREENTKLMHFEFEGLASDVIDHVKHERNMWRVIAFIMAAGALIEALTIVLILSR